MLAYNYEHLRHGTISPARETTVTHKTSTRTSSGRCRTAGVPQCCTTKQTQRINARSATLSILLPPITHVTSHKFYGSISHYLPHQYLMLLSTNSTEVLPATYPTYTSCSPYIIQKHFALLGK